MNPELDRIGAAWQQLKPAIGPAVTRFAPSPTGELHLGHVAHLRWLWQVAQMTAARIVVRMEDHDRSRCRPEFERSILDDLAWLGFVPDEVSLTSLRGPPPSPFRQGDQHDRYTTAFDRLRDAGLLYGCTCTRGDMGAPDASGERHYPGTCRSRPLDQSGRHVVRVMLPDEVTVVEDLLLGTLRQHPLRDHGDPMIRDALGQWSYQFCVVIDDMEQGVNLIVRGTDLTASTGRQLLLGRLLGRTAPFATVHHPLLLDEQGKKLSKRDQSTTVRSLRESGVTREQLLALSA